MLVVHRCTGPHLLAQGSSLKFIRRFAYCANVVVLGLFHEGLRVVLDSAVSWTVPRSEPCHCDETECENEDPGDGASRRRAKSGGQAVVTSDELVSGYSHVVQKDIVGELISNWLVTTLAALGFFLAMCGWTVCCADCLRPKRESMHGASSESWRAPVLVRVGGARRLTPVRHCESLGRWEERLLLWKVRDEEWVVTAPDGQVFVGELRSCVDATPVTSSCRVSLFLRPRAIAHQDQAARGEAIGKDHAVLGCF